MKLSHVALGFLLLVPPSAARAASVVVEAGQTHTLQDDLVLAGDDVLEIKGTAEKPCTLDGKRHRIRSDGKWTGSVKIAHCTLKNLGGLPKRNEMGQAIAPGPPAFDLKASGKGSVVVENCTLDASSAFHLQTNDNSSASIRNNTTLDNTTVCISKDLQFSEDAFVATGSSREKKLFQGNFLPRGKVVFKAPNWLVGGDRDEDSNIFIGLRIGVVADGEGTVIRGNYFHLSLAGSREFTYWSQVSVFTTGPKVLAEHNIIRDGEWIVRFVEGDFRYNIITDINDHDLMQTGSYGRIHHNIFSSGPPKKRPGEMYGCIAVIYAPKNPGDGIEIFNNVFDGGGRMAVPAIEIHEMAWATSIRNNVFYDFSHGGEAERKYRPHAMIRPGPGDKSNEAKPARMGYADYNLFYSPNSKLNRNYMLSVEGKTERKDAGFALNDITRGGKVDEQVDPKFKGPIPKAFPFTDDDIKARKVGMSKMLALYRDAYSPAPGSPLIDGGDPADGKGSFIGAVGTGKDAPNDKFGLLSKTKGKE